MKYYGELTVDQVRARQHEWMKVKAYGQGMSMGEKLGFVMQFQPGDVVMLINQEGGAGVKARVENTLDWGAYQVTVIEGSRAGDMITVPWANVSPMMAQEAKEDVGRRLIREAVMKHPRYQSVREKYEADKAVKVEEGQVGVTAAKPSAPPSPVRTGAVKSRAGQSPAVANVKEPKPGATEAWVHTVKSIDKDKTTDKPKVHPLSNVKINTVTPKPPDEVQRRRAALKSTVRGINIAGEAKPDPDGEVQAEIDGVEDENRRPLAK